MPAKEIKLGRDPDTGVYVDASLPELTGTRTLKRFTLLIENIQYPGDGGEEVDVDALNEHHARAICQQAIAEDYVPCRIVDCIGPRVGFYL